MGIGFVIGFWLLVFAVLTAVYFFLRFFAKETDGAAALKDVFVALFGVGSIVLVCLVIFTVGNVYLDYFYPNRIFTKNFGFEPTADIRIIEGSSFWTPLSYSAHLKFQANEETIQKIVLQGFSEKSKKNTDDLSSSETKKVLEQPQSRYFQKSDSYYETLAYDKESQNAYFDLHSVD